MLGVFTILHVGTVFCKVRACVLQLMSIEECFTPSASRVRVCISILCLVLATIMLRCPNIHIFLVRCPTSFSCAVRTSHAEEAERFAKKNSQVLSTPSVSMAKDLALPLVCTERQRGDLHKLHAQSTTHPVIKPHPWRD